jgi:hypothetical protein
MRELVIAIVVNLLVSLAGSGVQAKMHWGHKNEVLNKLISIEKRLTELEARIAPSSEGYLINGGEEIERCPKSVTTPAFGGSSITETGIIEDGRIIVYPTYSVMGAKDITIGTEDMHGTSKSKPADAFDGAAKDALK